MHVSWEPSGLLDMLNILIVAFGTNYKCILLILNFVSAQHTIYNLCLSFTHSYTHSYTRSYTHTYTHTYIHTHIHTHIHTYIPTAIGNWRLAAMQGTNQLFRLGVLLRDTSTRPGWDRTSNPPTARRQLLPPEPYRPLKLKETEELKRVYNVSQFQR